MERTAFVDLESLQTNAEEASQLLSSLANPNRLLVLCALLSREHSVGELEAHIGLSQSAISQHLARMRDAGIVQSRRSGQHVFYSLKNPAVGAVLEVLHRVYCSETNDKQSK